MRGGDSAVGTVKSSFHHTTTRLTQRKLMRHCPTFAGQPGAQASDSSHERHSCSRYFCAAPRVCETFSQVPCIRPPIVVRTNRIQEDPGMAAISLSKRHRYRLERPDVTRLILKPGPPPPRFSLARVWWQKSGADTEICWMKGPSGPFLNLMPAVTREKRKHGSHVCWL